MDKEEYPKCPECGGRTRRYGFMLTRTEGKVQKWQCVNCAHQFRLPKGD